MSERETSAGRVEQMNEYRDVAEHGRVIRDNAHEAARRALGVDE